MKGVIYFNFSQNLLKIDQLYLLKSFKEKTIKGSVQEISRVFLRLSKTSRLEETTFENDFMLIFNDCRSSK
jgi:hypothetical protein